MEGCEKTTIKTKPKRKKKERQIKNKTQPPVRKLPGVGGGGMISSVVDTPGFEVLLFFLLYLPPALTWLSSRPLTF